MDPVPFLTSILQEATDSSKELPPPHRTAASTWNKRRINRLIARLEKSDHSTAKHAYTISDIVDVIREEQRLLRANPAPEKQSLTPDQNQKIEDYATILNVLQNPEDASLAMHVKLIYWRAKMRVQIGRDGLHLTKTMEAKCDLNPKFQEDTRNLIQALNRAVCTGNLGYWKECHEIANKMGLDTSSHELSTPGAYPESWNYPYEDEPSED